MRGYRDGDAPQLAEVFFRSVREVAVSDYSADQVEVWAPGVREPAYFEDYATDGRQLYIAEDAADRVVGYVDLEADGHIDHLYCHPDVAGRGVATMLYLALEGEAREAGVQRLFVEASEPARRFFERHGFGVLGRREVVRQGRALHNYAMEKLLT